MRLADYACQDRVFEFEPVTGRFEPVKLAVPRAGRQGYCGIARLLKLKGRRVLVATYCQEGDAWLSVGAQRWPLYAPDLEMTHEESRWGFTCRFTIRRGAEVLISFEYPRQGRLLAIIDSTDDHLDCSLKRGSF